MRLANSSGAHSTTPKQRNVHWYSRTVSCWATPPQSIKARRIWSRPPTALTD